MSTPAVPNDTYSAEEPVRNFGHARFADPASRLAAPPAEQQAQTDEIRAEIHRRKGEDDKVDQRAFLERCPVKFKPYAALNREQRAQWHEIVGEFMDYGDMIGDAYDENGNPIEGANQIRPGTILSMQAKMVLSAERALAYVAWSKNDFNAWSAEVDDQELTETCTAYMSLSMGKADNNSHSTSTNVAPS